MRTSQKISILIFILASLVLIRVAAWENLGTNDTLSPIYQHGE